MSAADWEPSERGWRALQRRARAHCMLLARTDVDDGPAMFLAISEDGVRPFRSQHQIDVILDLADQVVRTGMAGKPSDLRNGSQRID